MRGEGQACHSLCVGGEGPQGGRLGVRGEVTWFYGALNLSSHLSDVNIVNCATFSAGQAVVGGEVIPEHSGREVK